MKVCRCRLRIPRGITGRISVLSWLVTLLTLTIFVLAIIPEQKRDLQSALDSKGRGIISSLRDVTASAAVSANYSSLVQQCLQVLAGDEAIDYVVISKNDGFSVIIERAGWRTETLNSSWRPYERRPTSGIDVVPLVGRRVFHVAVPFDYSGLHWGWMHVGLSLKAYDQSVARVYARTGLLAVLCVFLSLVASILYANRMVRPIASLEAVVRQVAHGDLSARADLQSGDEMESLANSFNMMADSILQRDRILKSVRLAAQQFLGAGGWQTEIVDVLEKVSKAAQADEACLVEVHLGEDGELHARQVAHWPQAGRAGWRSLDVGPLAGPLRGGELVRLEGVVLIPVEVSAEWFGYLGFYDDSHRDRVWSVAECDSFRALAGMLGASITRQRAQDALVEAKQTLEARVMERTSQLQEQVDAKERARAELAEAQRHLMDLSRLSGMAEVATGVLHNVGNVLNSVNVSASLVASRIQESRLGNLASLVKLLRQHSADLPSFLTADPKGQRAMPYLEKLSEHLQEERQGLLKELALLTDYVGHIKQIVATQQNYAKVSGLVETLSLADLVEDALRILQPALDRHQIRLEREFEALPPVATDKHKLIQILLNLLRNAKQAIKESGGSERTIRVCVRRSGEDRVRLEVRDSGVGLPAENLTRVFAHGFTTKQDGHGFGLHSGALAARQMGGTLWAESDGPGRGAIFVLEIPFTVAAQPVEVL